MAYGSCRELLEHEPDLVSVATPPGNHTAIAVELLESGCSVLLGKPPATTLADMDVLAAAGNASTVNGTDCGLHERCMADS